MIPEQLLTVKQVAKMTSVSVPTLYRWMEKGEFPKPIKLGCLSRWKQSVITDWIDEQAA